MTATQTKQDTYLVANRTADNDSLFQQMCRLSDRGRQTAEDRLTRDLFSLCYKIEPELVSGTKEEPEIFEAVKRLWDSGAIDDFRRNVPTRLEPTYSIMAAEALADRVRRGAHQIRHDKMQGLDIGGFPVAILNEIQEAAKQLQDAQDFQDDLGWGGQEPGQGEMQRVSPEYLDESLKFKRILNTPQMRDQIDMFGQLKVHARQTGKLRTDIQPEEIVDVSTGNDLTRLTPYGYLQITHPDLRLAGLKRYQNYELPEYRLEARSKKERGHMVVVLDTSGSMAHQKIILARAAGMLMREVAFKQKRDFAIIPMNSAAWGLGPTGGMQKFLPGDTTWQPIYWPKGKPDASQFLNVFGQAASGGTNGLSAIDACFRTLEIHPHLKGGEGDFVMITDGYCGMTQAAVQIRQRLKAANVNLYFILVEYPNEQEAAACTDPDKIIRIDQVTNLKDQAGMVQKCLQIGGPN